MSKKTNNATRGLIIGVSLIIGAIIGVIIPIMLDFMAIYRRVTSNWLPGNYSVSYAIRLVIQEAGRNPYPGGPEILYCSVMLMCMGLVMGGLFGLLIGVKIIERRSTSTKSKISS